MNWLRWFLYDLLAGCSAIGNDIVDRYELRNNVFYYIS